MKIFTLTLNQMLMMFTLILIGFLLKKKRILPDNTYITMSKLETFVFVPALTLHNMFTNCNVKTFTQNSVLILYGLVLILIAIALSYPLSALFIRNSRKNSDLSYQRNIYKYAMTFGNYGFMGNFIVLGIWGDEMFFKYTMLTMFVAIFCSGWGLYILIPKDQNAGVWENLKKGLLTPPMLALFIGIIGGLLGIRQYMPQFALSVLSNSANCMGPVAMILAGFVVGSYDFKKLLINKKVYIATALRLIVIPAVMVIALKLLHTPEEIVVLSLIAFGTPLGLNTIVYPAAFGGDTKTGASMAMISHTLSVITIPLMYLLFIVLL